MRIRSFLSRSAISPELLFYSWTDLKFNFKVFFNVDFNRKLFEPISKKWFLKTSSLIRNGKFIYEKTNFSPRLNLSSLSNLKFKIIENAFLKLLEPCFNSCLVNTNLNLIEYLR
jgi:hypothetical protein